MLTRKERGNERTDVPPSLSFSENRTVQYSISIHKKRGGCQECFALFGVPLCQKHLHAFPLWGCQLLLLLVVASLHIPWAYDEVS
jgi:hypothetical protein